MKINSAKICYKKSINTDLMWFHTIKYSSYEAFKIMNCYENNKYNNNTIKYVL